MNHFEILKQFILETGLEKGNISGEMALQSLEFLEQAVAAERLACARAVCPRCAANEVIFHHDEYWRHESGATPISVICRASAIWERGRDTEKAR